MEYTGNNAAALLLRKRNYARHLFQNSGPKHFATRVTKKGEMKMHFCEAEKAVEE